VAGDVASFTSSEGASVIQIDNRKQTLPRGNPPIDADPPLHTWTRRLILPAMSPPSVASHEQGTRELCRSLIDGFKGAGRADAAADYAQQIPVRVIGALLGIPEERSDEFVDWVRGSLESMHDVERRTKALSELSEFLHEQVADRRVNPGSDMISQMVATEVDGEPMDEELIVGESALLLGAGVDTTWSAIGSALLHLASHPADRRRLAADPDVLPLAIEEVLRFYSPVTMGRISTHDTEVGGCPVKKGDRVLLSFPAANRDPDAFEDADKFIIDREQNRHLAFGVGIHRCAGSNLARMELRVALEEWMNAIPEFELADPSLVTWAGGQVRGPRSVPVTF
jgi:cytochrome P450